MTEQKDQVFVADENAEWKQSVGWENLSPDKRMELLEREGKFDIDIFDDPPTKQLLPNQIDYEQKTGSINDPGWLWS